MPNDLDDFVSKDAYDASLRALAARGNLRRYRKGTTVIQEGDPGDTMFIVLSGRVRVYCIDEKGKEITFGTFDPGEYFGEMALDGGNRSASVITELPTACSVINRASLLSFIAQYPEFALKLLSKLIHRLRLATRDARNLAFFDVYGRLTQYLHELAVPQPDGTERIEERFTHREIASRLGCSREMVSRILKDLESGGYLQMADKHIVLVKKLPQGW